MSGRWLALAAVLGSLALAGMGQLWERRPEGQADYAALEQTGFAAGRDGRLVAGRALRVWTAAAAAPGRHLRVGWFPAPRRLRFAVRGGSPTVQVCARLQVAPASVPLSVPMGGGDWTAVECELPPGFQGWSMALEVSGAGPGFAISQPYGAGTGGARTYGLVPSLIAAGIEMILYGLGFAAAAHWLSARRWFEPHWTPLLAAALVAGCGYLTFWTYFLSPAAGHLFSWALLLAALARVGVGAVRLDRGTAAAALLVAVLAAVGLAVLHLFPSDLGFYELAQRRFLPELPGDNRLPFDFANLLERGVRPRELGAGWLTSDRPPLEEGWQLLTWPVAAALGLPADTASGVASVLLQLTWVFALLGLLRSFGMDADRAWRWCAVAGMNGFFLLNTLYTWPKLASAAFGSGAFGLWVLGGPLTARRLAAGGGLAALGLLAHGGIGFSLLPLLPGLAAQRGWRRLRPHWAALGAAALLVPWVCYQQGFAPPGNRLLKWHLAGHPERDDVSLWTALRAAYGHASAADILAQKGANFANLFRGDWPRAFDCSPEGAAGRRAAEFFHVFPALGLWNLGVVALAVGLLVRWPGGGGPKGAASRAGLLWWIGGSLVTWCVLMFSGNIVQQGSYGAMLALFLAAALGFEQLGGWLLPVVALGQAYVTFATWLGYDQAVALVPAAILGVPGGALLYACGGGAATWMASRLRPVAARSPTGS